MTRKANNILNYTTGVEASKTVGEIVRLLAGKEVNSINLDYEGGKVVAITFVVKVADSMIPFKLKPNIAGVHLRREIPSMAQAERVAWRIVLRWVEAQLAMVESNLAEIGQVFLPYAMRGDGETLWQAFQASNTKQLTNGKEVAQ